MAVLDPHPEDYYYKEFSHYNWYTFPNGSTADWVQTITCSALITEWI
ncbi:Putative uncharacterized protein [Thermobacillus xylanilyticus]|jgi:hypothetical protein|uniref:Uncharacterized protein n=1 Tax=Thermobacillus xylanilyticus TaxID=76633 RepID=A0ABN7RYH6_THEXY|nr:Putative uncharacterized protein [Thermobacillus xylanilyticus]